MRKDAVLLLAIGLAMVFSTGCSEGGEVSTASVLPGVDGGTAGGGGDGEVDNTDVEQPGWNENDAVTESDVITEADAAASSLDGAGTESQGDAGDEPCDGCFGSPCDDSSDCFSGYCVDGPDGSICTKTCTDECPPLYGCKSVTGSGGDPVFICVYDHMQYCRPCDSGADCAHPMATDTVDVCLPADSSGEAGAFCATPCSVGGACPDGATCQEFETEDGVSQLCVPEDGECVCNALAISAAASTSCSVSNEFGVCGGVRTCGDDGTVSPCGATVPTAEVCNNLDDNCDGETDEGFDTKGQPCDGDDEDQCEDGLWQCDENGLFCSDDADAGQEVCDDDDNDCDGVIDEGFDDKGQACDGNDADMCADGVWVCEAFGLTCSDDDTSTVETCNGVDDDCDGETDEDYPQLGEPCDGLDADLCTNGAFVCSEDGLSLACAEDGEAIAETCNDYDDDCDGAIDEDVPENGQPCDGEDADLCTDGSIICTADGPVCMDDEQSAEEVCDDEDNDCDGAVDETFPTKGDACDGNDADICLDGVLVCENFGLVCADDDEPIEELCDDIDNDCDGETDEGFIAKGQPCDGDDADQCALGVGVCNGTIVVCDEPGDGIVESCNGLDDDCDGSLPVDEVDGDNDGVMPCENDCNDEEPTIGAGKPELCDDVDQDCDGETDEDFKVDGEISFVDSDGTDGLTLGDACGPGACQGGSVVCDASGEGLQCSSAGQAAAETCDAVDNDCDGDVDETFKPGGEITLSDVSGGQVALGEPCGVGACEGGEAICSQDGTALVCSSAGQASQEVCDAIDNDCDGQTDDETLLVNDLTALANAGCLTQGVCALTGAVQAECMGGTYACLMLVKSYQEVENLCDGLDNDCDGQTDEGLSTDGDNDGHYTYGSCAQPNQDCDDSNPEKNPGKPEKCDGFDNNCDNVIDPEGSQDCTTYYSDGDNDGYGTTSQKCLCTPSGSFTATSSNDCYDSNSAVKPGQTTYYATDRGDGSFDYNCDGQETKEGPAIVAGNCAFFEDFCSGNAGWKNSVPACGQTKKFFSECKWRIWPPGCYWSQKTDTTMKCR